MWVLATSSQTGSRVKHRVYATDQSHGPWRTATSASHQPMDGSVVRGRVFVNCRGLAEGRLRSEVHK